VNSGELKRILAGHRPGTADVREPEVARALEVALADPDLRSWLDEQAAVQAALRERFRRLPVPEGLRDRIMAETVMARPVFWRPYMPRLAAAAALLLLLGVAGLWLQAPKPPRLDNFRERMVGTVLREYRMDIESVDLEEIRGYLRANAAPADYRLPAGLGALPVVGGGRLTWQNQPVAMVCFEQDDGGLLFLFVVEQEALPDPPGAEPEFVQVNRLMTAAWSADRLAYVLAGELGEASLRRLF